ncbi:MAG TPA: metallophosphoesterase [Bdellovibrionales bacterium]|nr:metallophosphoesterase [Bdellovibrionales bacterium]
MRRSFNTFLVIFSAIHYGLTAYIGLRLAETPAWWALLLVISVTLWSLPVVHWRPRDREPPAWAPLAQQASYVCMAIMSWLLVLTVLRDLTFFVSSFTENAGAVRAALSGPRVFTAAFALTLLGSWRAFTGPQIKRVRVPLEGAHEGLRGLRIVQISDLHVGPTIGRRYVERVVAKVRALDPHLTVLTGDILDGPASIHKNEILAFSELEPRGRVYFAPGNHEYYHRIDQWIPELERHGTKILLNSGELIEHESLRVWIGGITDPAAAQMRLGEAPNPGRAALGGEEAHFKVLLSHRPGYADEAHKAGFHLQLSGHTHGGQFFPWTQVARFFHTYLAGLFRHESMWVYVSVGTGTWGPPARLGTTPELTLIELS